MSIFLPVTSSGTKGVTSFKGPSANRSRDDQVLREVYDLVLSLTQPPVLCPGRETLLSTRVRQTTVVSETHQSVRPVG